MAAQAQDAPAKTEPKAKSRPVWRLVAQFEPQIEGALVSMNPRTGEVLASVGGFSFERSQFNRATQALRQPGSSFKPIVYSVAMDNGLTPPRWYGLALLLPRPLERQGLEPGQLRRRLHGAHVHPLGPGQVPQPGDRPRGQQIGMKKVVEAAQAMGFAAISCPICP
jgi:penicillin-binding protein 1A